MKEHFLFFKQFITKPATTGAIAPSSTHLAKEIVTQAQIANAKLILEFGPGTGVFTQQILTTKQPDANFIAIERNPQLAAALNYKFPNAEIISDCISNIESILNSHGITDKADSIVCGLPWAAFDDNLQQKLLSATYNILKEDGIFTTFAYLQGLLLPSGQKFKKLINSKFANVQKSKIVWRNLPPAFVYKCQKITQPSEFSNVQIASATNP